ncbi:MAG: hypothetical protein ACHQQQ_09390 [Bacteroidota bacterium]
MYYYRIYDDKEELNFLKSSLAQKRVRELLNEYEKDHQEYYNNEFVEFLKGFDPNAELIDVINITY